MAKVLETGFTMLFTLYPWYSNASKIACEPGSSLVAKLAVVTDVAAPRSRSSCISGICLWATAKFRALVRSCGVNGVY